MDDVVEAATSPRPASEEWNLAPAGLEVQEFVLSGWPISRLKQLQGPCRLEGLKAFPARAVAHAYDLKEKPRWINPVPT